MTRATVSNKHNALRGAMTVSQLIDALQNCDPNAVVVMASDYGDHSHTQQALPISECDDINCDQYIVESRYSHSGLALEETDGSDEDDENDSDDDRSEAAAEQNYVILK